MTTPHLLRRPWWIPGLALPVVLLALTPWPLAALDISTTDKYAWSETTGWLNSRPTHGGVTVHLNGASSYLSGYAWAENLGWVKLGSAAGGPYANSSSTNWGVNADAALALSGYAWSETCGWVNFRPTHGGVAIDTATGTFTGHAWAANLGFIRFSASTPTAYATRTETPPISVAFAAASSSVAESAGTTSLTVQLSGTSTATVTVDYALTAGTATGGGVDFTAASGTLSFAPGETSKTISVTVASDSVPEMTEWLTVTLSAPTNAVLGTQATHRLDILDVSPGNYLAIDVSGGAGATSYPVTYLDTAPSDLLTNDVWRTSKILLRRIAAGSFTMGSPEGEIGRRTDETQHQVTLTQDYCMAVFEVTQKQWYNVMGTDPSTYKGDQRPVETVSWAETRGGTWPSGDPAADTFVARLRTKAGLPRFDLPTEAQWEHACRAGTTKAYNDYTRNGGAGADCLETGDSADANLQPLGRYVANMADGRGGYNGHTTVGSYQVNAWGLYDMHGNACEWCLDWDASYAGPVSDPAGGASGDYRVCRGGDWHLGAAYCRSARRMILYPNPLANAWTGLRLAISAATTVQFQNATASVAESAGTATVTVTLSGPSPDTVTVQYATSNGTATAGSDYTAATGALSFAPGETSKTVSISIADDLLYEGNETLTLTLSAPVNAVLGTTVSHTLTIQDDETRTPSELIAYWPFDGTPTAVVGTSGANVGSVAVAADRNGVAGGALAFAATTFDTNPATVDGSYVSVPGGGGLNGATQASISMWVRWTGLQDGNGGNFGAVLARQANGSFTNNIITLTPGNDPAADVLVWHTATLAMSTGTTVVGTDVWHHIAVTFGNGWHRLYMDGILEASSNSSVVLHSNAGIPLTIGAHTGDQDTYSTSTIDDVGIFDNVLTAAKVKAVYELSKNGLLRYSLGQADQLLGLYDAGSGSDLVGGRQWSYATGLTTGVGSVVVIGAQIRLQLDALGNGVVAPTFPGGAGTAGDPYPITTLAQLQAVKDCLSSSFILMNDIDATATATWNSGAGFEPIGARPGDGTPFTGAFDGQGHKVTSLTISRPASGYAGVALFGWLQSGGTVQNLGLAGGTIAGQYNVGALAGMIATGGTVSNCYATTAVTGQGSVGGLVGGMDGDSVLSNSYATGAVNGSDSVGCLMGENHFGTVSGCYATGAVSGGSSAGGLVGYNYGTLSNCYATGAVSGTTNVGGLVGHNYHYSPYGPSTGLVENCYATGAVSGSSAVGGLLGVNEFSAPVSNAFYDQQTSGQSDTGKGEPRTTAAMKQQATFADWDFTNTWRIVENQIYPRLAWQPPVVQFALASSSVAESAGTAGIAVTLSGASTATVTVQYATSTGTATAGSDYTAASGTLTFSPGETSKTVSVTILNDSIEDPAETFTVTLSSPTNATLGATTVHTLTIADDESDSDGDGMPDAWEVTYGLNPTSNTDATTDPDSDGYTNLREYRGMSDPRDANSLPEGRLIWAKRAGGSGYDIDGGTAALPDGSLLVTGYFTGTATFGATLLTSAGVEDTYLAKYGADGSVLWARRAGGTGLDAGNGLAVLADGSCVASGRFTGPVTFGQGEPGQTVLTGSGIYMARYSADGALAWARSAGSASGNGSGHSIGVAPDGTVVVLGLLYDTAVFGAGEANQTEITSAGATDLFLAKYNAANGSLVWAKRAGGTAGESCGGLGFCPDGTILVGAAFTGAATFGPGEANVTALTSAGAHDIVLAKYNVDGTLLWAKRTGGTEDDTGRGLACLPDGSAYLTGDFGDTVTFGAGEPNATVLTAAGSPDVFVARYNTDGSLAWAKRAGGTGLDDGLGLAVLPAGGFLVCGNYQGTVTFGPGEARETQMVSPASYLDTFLARYEADGRFDWVTRLGADWCSVPYSVAMNLAVLPNGMAAVHTTFKTTANPGAGEPNATTLTTAGEFDLAVATFAWNTIGAPTVEFSVASSSTGESAGTVAIPVTLGSVSSRTVTVNYATANGTATAGSDFTAGSGTLSFAPGETSKTIPVTISADSTPEMTEWLTATLSSPTNAVLGPQASHRLDILDVSPGNYLAIDVSGGAGATSYPVTYLDTAPSDLLTNAAWKTTKVLLRRIAAGTFTMGSPVGELGKDTDEAQHGVILSRGFYLGVFEVTQRQWYNVMGTDPSNEKGDTRPVESVAWSTMRGGDWPGSPAGQGAPDAASFAGRLQTRAGLALDLPTEAQWEYACRAGTTSALYSGLELTATDQCPNVAELGRYLYNRSDGKGGYSGLHTAVGSYLPNAWGLYDMLGNVAELAADWYVANLGTSEVSDPTGAVSGTSRVVRGSSNGEIAGECRSARREQKDPALADRLIGLRLATRSATTVQFQSATASVAESAGTATVTVTLSGPSPDTVTVQYATSNGTATAGSDYTEVSQPLTFAPGVTTTQYAIAITDDAAEEGPETFTVTLSSPTNAVLGATTVQTVTIEVSDDTTAPTVSGGTASFTQVTVTFSEPVNVSDAQDLANYALASPVGTTVSLTGRTATYDAGTRTVTITGFDPKAGELCGNNGFRVTVRNVRDLAANAIVDNGTTNVVNGTVPPLSGLTGRIAYALYPGGEFEVYTMNADGTAPTRLTTSALADQHASFSPDGSRLAFCTYRDGNGEIYVMNSDGSSPTRLTSEAADDEFPKWSPGGSRIALDSQRTGTWQIFAMCADGSGQTRLPFAGVAIEAAWSPDGTKLVFVGSTGAGPYSYELWTMNADGSNQVRLTNNSYGERNPAWSPDGLRLAYSSLRDGLYGIYTSNPDGSGEVRLTTDARNCHTPRWSPDGSKIAFSSDRAQVSQEYDVYAMNADGTGQTRLTWNSWAYAWDWGPRVSGPALHHVDLDATTITLAPGGVHVFTATAKDAANATLTWPTFGWNAPTGGGALVDHGDNTATFTAIAPGTYTVKAINVQCATATVTVDVPATFAGGDGSAGNPYQITTLEQLQAVKLRLSSHFLLMNDIAAAATASWYNGAGFQPIGTNPEVGAAFTGTFNGQGYRITNLTINRPTSGYSGVGLFGWIESGGTVQDLGLAGGTIAGQYYVGELAGMIEAGCTVSNCYATGAVNGPESVGGGVGGLVGYIATGGTVSSCYATGAVNGPESIGGLAGANHFGTLANCYATGAVSGETSVGGLLGYNFSNVSNCYATGAVSGNSKVGGLLGSTWAGTVSSCYATGTVSGNSSVGGLLGENLYGGVVSDSFYDQQTSGQSDNDGRGTPKTTAAMKTQATFTGWDFAVTWRILEWQSYPYLAWQTAPTPPNPDSDGDGLPDAWETYYLGGLTQTGTGDADSDGYSNLAEYNARTNPSSAASFPLWYVKAGVAGANTGTSWANAFTTLQPGIDAASANGGGEVWVAAGTYKPTTGTDRAISFELKSGVKVYGGFAGTTETLRTQRNWATNVTTLSGDTGASGTAADNSYHVVTGANSAVLDGFTISAGYADGSGSDAHGGGMYNAATAPTVSNCTFAGNTAATGAGVFNSSSTAAFTNCRFTGNTASEGAGMHCASGSSVTVTACAFTGNSASTAGAMYCEASTPTIDRCVFAGNTATSNAGAVYAYNCTPGVATFADCLFVGNSVRDYHGGGALNCGCSPAYVNCTFRGNSVGGNGGAMYNISAASATIRNCILWGNTAAASGGEICNDDATATVACSDIEGGLNGAKCAGSLLVDGTGNLNADPRFVRNPSPGLDATWGTADDDYGDLRLADQSPCTDAGFGDGGATVPATDILGNGRYDDLSVANTGSGTPAYVDIGAYERQGDSDVAPPSGLAVASANPAVPTAATPYAQFSTNDTTIDVTWTLPTDPSGVVGYSWAFDRVADTVPDTVSDGAALPTTFTATPDGIWFLHVRSVDTVGNWSDTVHAGPWVVDTTNRTWLVIDVSAGPTATYYPVRYASDWSDLSDLSDTAMRTTHILLRRIPAGVFWMGSPEGEADRQADETQHSVTLAQGYYVGVLEVTQGQWYNVMGSNPSAQAGDRRPVEMVSWEAIRGGVWPGVPAGSGAPAAGAFVGRLRAMTGGLLAFDLPTEAQWEYACRAGTTKAYNDYAKSAGAGADCLTLDNVPEANLEPLAWYYANSYSQKHQEAGTRQANAWGLYDMHGNLGEWCLDWLGVYPGTVSDPSGASSGSDRLFRGGAWYDWAKSCRSALRQGTFPADMTDGRGFRLALPGADAVMPRVELITSTSANGTYRLNDTVNVTLQFTTPVTLAGGNLNVTLSTGDVLVVTAMASTSTSTSTYTVGAGDQSSDLTVTALALDPGATLRDADGRDVVLTLPASANLGDLKDLVIQSSTVQFVQSSSSVQESAGATSLAVTLDPASTLTVTVDYAVVAASSTATGGGVDYTLLGTGTLTFAPGDTSEEIGLTLVDDWLAEGNETVVVELGTVTNAARGPFALHTLAITDSDTAPSNITLTNAGVEENRPAGTVVGTLGTNDADAGDTWTYSLVAGTGDTGNGAFELVGNELRTRASFDYEVQASYSIRVQVSDRGNPAYQEALIIGVVDVDDTAPTVVSIVRANSAPALTNAAQVVYTVTFSEAVSGVTAAHVDIVGTAEQAGATVASVTGSGATWTVTVNTVAGLGTLGILIDDTTAGIADTSADHHPLAPSSPTTQGYTVDRVAPTVQSVVRADAGVTLTNAAQVLFTVTFSEAVTGFGAGRVAPAGQGGQAGATVAEVTGSGTTWTVRLNTVAGASGTLGIVIDDTTAGILDVAGNAVGGTYSTGQTYSVDRVAPTVASLTPSTASPTNGSAVAFAVTFSEAVTGFDATADLVVTADGTVQSTGVNVVGSSATDYTATVTGVTGDGTLRLACTLVSPTVADLAGNALASTVTSQAVTIDHTVPTLAGLETVDADGSGQLDALRVTFSEPVLDTSVNPAQFNLGLGIGTTAGVGTGTTANDAVILLTTGGAALDTGTKPSLRYTRGTLSDLAGNLLASISSPVTPLDKAAPVALSAVAANGSGGSEGIDNTDSVTLTFSEDINTAQAAIGLDIDTVLALSGGHTWLDGTPQTGTQQWLTARVFRVMLSTAFGPPDIAPGDVITPDGATLRDLATPTANVCSRPLTITGSFGLAPVVLSVLRAVPAAATTNAAEVQFAIVFSKPVTGLTAGNLSLVTTGGQAGATLGEIGGSDAAWTVEVTTVGAAEGTIRVDVDRNLGTIHDVFGTVVTTAFTGGETYTVDRAAPTLAIGAPSPALAAAGPVNFTVTYTGASTVTLAPTDVSLNTSGTAAAASVTVSGAGSATRTVTVASVTGDGTIGLTIAVGTATDAAGNVAGAAGPSTTFSADNSAPPAPTALDLATADDTGDSNTDNLTRLATGLTVSGSAEAGATVALFDGAAALGGGTAAQFASPGLDVSLAAGTHSLTAVAADAAGNPSGASAALVVTVDTEPPGVALSGPSAAVTRAGPVTYTVTYTGASSVTLATGDVTLNRSGTANGIPSASGSGTATRTVTLQSVSGDGTLGIGLAAGTATDAAGNAAAAAGPSATFDVDNSPPAVPTGLDLAAADDTGVSDTDNLTRLTSGLTITGTAPAGATVNLLDGVTLLASGPAADFASPGFDVSLAAGLRSLSAVATDAAGNPSSSSSPLGLTIDTAGPSVQVEQAAGQADPDSTAPLLFTVTFGERAYGFDTSDVTIGGTAAPATVTVAEQAPNNGTVYEIAVSALAGPGTVTCAVAGSRLTDAAGNANSASASVDGQVTYSPVLLSVAFTAESQSVGESGGTASFTIALSGACEVPVSAPYTVSGTATNPAHHDLAAGTATFAPGDTTRVVTFHLTGNDEADGSRTVVVDLGTPTHATLGAPARHTVTILDDDVLPVIGLTAAGQTVPESVGTVTVTVGLTPASARAVTVPYTVSGTATRPADHDLLAGSVTIAAGSTSQALTFAVVDDSADETNETVIVTLGAPSYGNLGGITEHTITITDNDVVLTVASAYGTALPPVGTNVLTEGGSVTATVAGSPAAGPSGTRYLVTGWTGTGDVPASGSGASTGAFVLRQASSVTWNWQTQYRLTTAVSGSGSVTADSAGDGGWYADGTVVGLTATPGAFTIPYRFSHWTGGVPAGHETDNPLDLTVDAPYTLTAVFVDNDQDWDLMADDWEEFHFGGHVDPLDDADLDGFNNYSEFVDGSNPRDPASPSGFGGGRYVDTATGHAYRYCAGALTWEQAGERCELMGGHLATVASETENGIVYGRIAAGVYYAWVGGTDRTGAWQWVTSPAESWSFTKWRTSAGEPNGALGYDFLGMVGPAGAATNRSKWSALPETYAQTAGYVCEWDYAGDLDADGLPDAWEMRWFGNLLESGSDDSESAAAGGPDGLTNAEEYVLNTDPTAHTQTYRVTTSVVAGPAGSRVDGGGVKAAGTNVTLTAVLGVSPYAYAVSEWREVLDGGGTAWLQDGGSTYSITGIARDYTIEVQFACTGGAPTPSPLTWAVEPVAMADPQGRSAVTMTVAAASHPLGVEYWFEETTGTNRTSGWIPGRTWECSGLTPNTSYTFRARARCNSGDLAPTGWTPSRNARTLLPGLPTLTFTEPDGLYDFPVDGFFTFRWTATSDLPAGTTLSLYLDNDTTTLERRHTVREGLGFGTTSYAYSTASLANGESWYVWAEVNDGSGLPGHVLSFASAYPFVVDNRTPTVMTCELLPVGTVTAVYGLSVQARAGVYLSGTATPVPAGRIDFTFAGPAGQGGTAEGSAPLNGTSLKTYVPSGVGAWQVYASWPGTTGTPGYRPSASPPVPLQVTQGTATLALSAGTNPPLLVNQSRTFSGLLGIATGNQGVSLLGQAVELLYRDPSGQDRPAVTSLCYTAAGHFTSPEYVFDRTGLWTVRARFAGNANLTAVESAAITVHVLEVPGYVILCQGKLPGNRPEGLDEHALTLATLYQACRDLGIGDDLIQYYTYKADATGRDGDPSEAALRAAVTQWAQQRMNEAPGDLYIVLVNHGSVGAFHMDRDVLTPPELRGMLDTLQAGLSPAAQERNIIVVLGMCHSGSFVDQASGPKRIVVASCDTLEVSQRGARGAGGIRDGELFVSSLFGQLRAGQDLFNSFEAAAQATREQALVTTPGGAATQGTWVQDQYGFYHRVDYVVDNLNGTYTYRLTSRTDGTVPKGLVYLVVGIPEADRVGLTARSLYSLPTSVPGTDTPTGVAGVRFTSDTYRLGDNRGQEESEWFEVTVPRLYATLSIAACVGTAGSSTNQLSCQSTLSVPAAVFGAYETNGLYADASTQHALLDDNGDGQASHELSDIEGDGVQAMGVYLGVHTNAPTAMEVLAAAPPVFLGSSVTAEPLPGLWVEFDRAGGAISAVWAEVKPPTYTGPDGGGSMQYDMDLPSYRASGYEDVDAFASRWAWATAPRRAYDSSAFATPGAYQVFYFGQAAGEPEPAHGPYTWVFRASGTATPSAFGLLEPAAEAGVASDTTFRWEASESPEGTVRYLFLLWADSAGTALHDSGPLQSSTAILLDHTVLEDGEYWWEVRAVDPAGNARPRGELRHVTVNHTNAGPPSFLKGLILDATTRLPLPTAEVQIEGQPEETWPGGGYVVGLQAGTYQVTCRAAGCQTQTRQVVVGANTIVQQDFLMAFTGKVATVRLVAGWNLVSLPVVPTDPSVAAVFADLVTHHTVPEDHDHVPVVWGWDGTAYVAADTLEPLRGYWVYSPRTVYLSVAGEPVTDPTRDLLPGWNLVGPSLHWDVPVLPVSGTQPPWYGWDGGAARYVAAAQQPAPYDNLLKSAAGYWVYVDADTDVQLGPTAR